MELMTGRGYHEGYCAGISARSCASANVGVVRPRSGISLILLMDEPFARRLDPDHELSQ